MQKQIRVMMIGAHPDDCDFRCGGLALKYARAGHKVKFLSMCDGSRGHQSMPLDEIAARRRRETQNVAKMVGIEYDVWNIHDCELIADLKTRMRLVCAIREFCPDILFCSRLNDYHVDHRNTSLLVQDASYLLIVPNYCPETPAMKESPVILHFYDHFQNPPFHADIVVRIDDVIEEKFKMLACHESQVFEWLPYSKGILDQVPVTPKERLRWLHEPCIPRDGAPLDEGILKKNLIGSESEYREAVAAHLYRNKLIDRYGQEGRRINFAEAFSVSEYGKPLTEQDSWELIPI